jgi:hypothetical protein
MRAPSGAGPRDFGQHRGEAPGGRPKENPRRSGGSEERWLQSQQQSDYFRSLPVRAKEIVPTTVALQYFD